MKYEICLTSFQFFFIILNTLAKVWIEIEKLKRGISHLVESTKQVDIDIDFNSVQKIDLNCSAQPPDYAKKLRSVQDLRAVAYLTDDILNLAYFEGYTFNATEFNSLETALRRGIFFPIHQYKYVF
jgi:hypothetical protein